MRSDYSLKSWPGEMIPRFEMAMAKVKVNQLLLERTLKGYLKLSMMKRCLEKVILVL